jgi:hypothetical protein
MKGKKVEMYQNFQAFLEQPTGTWVVATFVEAK